MQYLDKFPTEIREMFLTLKNTIYEAEPTVGERMWAGLPSYYSGNAFVRLIPFKDHINIEAAALQNYKPNLQSYKFTPKGMLQIFTGQAIPLDIIKEVFRKTYGKL